MMFRRRAGTGWRLEVIKLIISNLHPVSALSTLHHQSLPTRAGNVPHHQHRYENSPLWMAEDKLLVKHRRWYLFNSNLFQHHCHHLREAIT